MPVKRPVDTDDDGEHGAHHHVPTKASRHDLHQDYDSQQAAQSASARKKGLSSRTGQACDRCKVRVCCPNAMPCHHISMQPLIQTSLLLTLSPPTDQEDPLRPSARRLLAVRAEQYRMSYNRPHYRPCPLSWPCGEP